MIVSVSRRTDIPAFYSQWLMNRLAAGFAMTRNPFNAKQVSRIELTPEAVSLLVFWTRNPLPLLPHLPDLDAMGYRYYFHVTLTGYPKALESATLRPAKAIDAFCQLAAAIGPQKVIWRYDPVLLCSALPVEAHIDRFARLARALEGSTQRVVVSLADLYAKSVRNLTTLPGFSFSDIAADHAALGRLLPELQRIAASHGIRIQGCAEDPALDKLGLPAGKCIDEALIRELFGLELAARRDKGQRLHCGCIRSVDIGAYESCLHGCRYCYATTDPQLARRNYLHHNPLSPFLLGEPDADTLAWLAEEEAQGRLF